MKVNLFIVPLLCCYVLMFGTLLQGVSGKWSGTLKTPDNVEYPLAYNLKVDGDKLTGTGLSPQGEFEITNGKLTGEGFTFGLQVDGKTAKHTGKYVAVGDSVSLDIDFDGNSFTQRYCG